MTKTYPTLTANDLYKRPCVEVSNDPYRLVVCHTSHLPEVPQLRKSNCFIKNLEKQTPDFEIRYLKTFMFDERRSWLLATVWYKSLPVMIIQNAGREGEDHAARYITNSFLFKEMVMYILRKFEPQDDNFEHDVIYDDAPLEALAQFYGYHLDEDFEEERIIKP